MRLTREEWQAVAAKLREVYDDDRWAAEIERASQQTGADPLERIAISLGPDDHAFVVRFTMEELGWEWDSSGDPTGPL
jgi:hypothetical protein